MKKSCTIKLKTLKKNTTTVAAKTIIEINGRKYDARTGEIVNDAPTVAHGLQPNTGVIDGFQRPRTVLRSSVTRKQLHKAQKSQTLVRSAVKKPVSLVKPAVSTQSHNVAAADLRRNLLTTPAKRLEHAKHTNQSASVARFAPARRGLDWLSATPPRCSGPRSTGETRKIWDVCKEWKWHQEACS